MAASTKRGKDGTGGTVTLRIGDYVTFRTAKTDAFLSAEGILLEDLYVNPNITSLNDALFCVHLPRQYSASRELEEYEAEQRKLVEAGHVIDKNDKSAVSFLNALRRGRDNELKLNNRYMQQKKGQEVKFGDVIQLFHVKSGKYLTIMPKELANTERENIRVSLNAAGTVYSTLVVMPRFKIDREGDVISDNTDLFLTVSERRNEYLHCADRESASGSFPEINCSLEATSWKMSIFQSSTDAADPTLILAAELVYILDPETNASIMPAKEQEDEGSDDGEGKKGQPDDGDEEGDGEGEEGKDEEDEDDEGKDEEEEDEEGSGAGGSRAQGGENAEEKIVLQTMHAKGHIDTRMLWMVEFKSKTLGGPVYWRTTQVRIKNLCTGYYLKVTPTERYADETQQEIVTEYVLGITKDPNDPGTMYSLTEASGTSKLLLVGKAYSIKSEFGCYLERGVEEPHIRGAHGLRCGMEKTSAVNFQFNKFALDAVDVDDVKQQEPLDVYVSMATRDYLEKYLRMIVLPKVSHANTLWPTADRSDLEIFLTVIKRSIFFTHGFPISATNVNLETDKSDVALARSRQKNMKEQRILDILHSLIETLIPLSERADEIASLPRSQQPILSAEEQAVAKMGNILLENSMKLLYSCILDNPDNQMHVADNIRTLLAHLGSQPLAGKCVTEMLSKNKELQETKIGDEEIEIFVHKLRSSKMNAMYLQLLQSCCSCEGEGVDGNQCRVTEHLFSNTNDIIINIHPDYTKITPVDWKPNGLYLPEVSVPGSAVTGEHLYLSGLPQLSLAWTTNSIDYSPLGLFGKLSVNVQELYRVISADSSSASSKSRTDSKSAAAQMIASKKSQSSQQKEAVANYFIAQMMLCAEMCMDRNYVAMHANDNLYPYEVLVTILKLNVRDDLRAAAARLLRCLYVDRDPQAETKIPVLTRTWSSVTKNAEAKLPFVGETRKYVFGLLQQILADYIASMANKSWTTMAKGLLELYSTLINFNFYGTLERMEDVIKPLIRAIDRRSILYPGDAAYVEQKESRGGGRENGGGSSPLKAATLSINNDEETKEEDLDAVKDEDLEGGGGERQSGEEKESWQERYYQVTESIPYLLSVIILTIAAVVVTIWQIVAAPDIDDSPSSSIGIWGLLVLSLFILDLSSRAYVNYYKFGVILPFIMSVFNQIDFLVICIDIVFLGLPTEGGSNASVTKVLRLVRLVRLLRLFRVVKLVQVVVESMEVADVDSYKLPLRYSKAPTYELDAMVEIVNILLYASKVIADRNLSIFLRKFYEWQSGADTRDPSVIFEKVIEDGKVLTLGVQDMDHIFLDCIMFQWKPLVQGALDIIMLHHSTRRTLLDNAAKVQLLISGKRERQFQQIQSMISQLEQNAETHELWGELQSDADYAVNKQTKDILKELSEMLVSKRFTLDLFEGSSEPDKAIQDLYSNLGFFPIAQKVLGLLENVEEEEDGTLSEVSLNTRELCKLCNDVVYWFCLDNENNQEQVYEDIDYFFESLDGEVNSHLVVKAIFSKNFKLMKLIPHSNLANMVERIVKNGKSHHYLSLLVSVTHVGSNNIVENQYKVMEVLTQGGRLQRLGMYLVSRTDKKYAAKVQQMEQRKGVKDASPEDLTPPLAYYVTLLDIFAGCASGRSAAASIEAKIQSLINFVDVIECVLDVRSHMAIKIINLKFLFNCVIDVNLPVPGLVENALMWKLVNVLADKLGKAADFMNKVNELGWDHADTGRQEMEFAILGMMTITVFYEKYYNRELFAHDSAVTDERVHMTNAMADQLATNLFMRVKALYDMDSLRFKDDIKSIWMKRALKVLNRSTARQIDPDLKAILAPKEDAYRNDGPPENETGEHMILRKYQEFLRALNESEEVQKGANDENVEFITVLEGIPFVKDKVTSDLRYELLIKKVVKHVRDNMVIIDNETRLENRVSTTAIWLIKSFRAMIENKMGMSIFERDDDGGEKEDLASQDVKTALNNCGATALCLDLIVDGTDPELQVECIRLLVGLLFKEGGNQEAQKLMFEHLSLSGAFLFFKQAESILEELAAWHEWQGDVVLEEGQEPELPDKNLIMRMLQLMSEGHYEDNQNLMREQPNSDESVNLLDPMVTYLKALSHHPCRTSTTAGIRLGALIVEVLQKPCVGNQEHLALNTDVLETCNRLLRATRSKDCVVDEEIEFKMTIVQLVQGILEGQSLHGLIYERVLSVMHVDVIQHIALEEGDPEEQECEDYPGFKTACLVLLNMLCESKKSIKQEFGIPDDLKAAASSGGVNIGSVEIFWNDELHLRYFHIPDICDLLAKASKDQLVESNDRETQELKLIDFLDRSHGLYKEVKHQSYLLSVGVNAIFSRRNQEITTWFSFGVAITINFLYLCYYNWDLEPTDDAQLDDHSKTMGGWFPGPGMVFNPNISIGYPDSIAAVINALNYLQIISSFFTLTSMIVVRLPVVYQTFTDETGLNMDPYKAILWTALDAKFLYYVGYFTFSVLGAAYDDLFATFLLLDLIVKNSTARNVLNAIVVPIGNIVWALVIVEIVNYIFAFYCFLDFAFDFGVDDGQFAFGLDACYSLWNCFKFTADYGARLGGGIGDAFRHTYGKRWLLDTMYFFAVIICTFNLVAGVIITTFGMLREKKNLRMIDTEQVCFICGIEKQTFDRDRNDPNGFKQHIRDEHNMWNYLYFIFYIWEQDKDDDDGMEYYVRHAIEKIDIEWMPMNRAMAMDQAASMDEQLRTEFRAKLSQSKDAIGTRMKKMQTNAITVLEQLNLALKKDHVVAGMEDDEGLGGLGGLGDFFNSTSRSRGGPGSDMGDFSVVSLVGHGVSRVCLPKRITLLVLEVCGLRLPSSQMDTVYVRVECEEGSYSCPAELVEVSAGRVVLQADKLLVSSEAQAGDARNVSITVCMRNRADIEIVLGNILVSLAELLESDGLQSEKIFMSGEDVCSITLAPSAAYAVAGIDDE